MSYRKLMLLIVLAGLEHLLTFWLYNPAWAGDAIEAEGVKRKPDARPAGMQGNDSADQLPRGAHARLGSLRFRQTDAEIIHSLMFSPDGKILASAGGTQEGGIYAPEPLRIFLWEAATGRLLRKFAGYEPIMQGVCFSRDGQLLASTGSDLRVWNPNTGRLLYTLTLPRLGDRDFTQKPTSPLFLPDSKTLLAAGANNVYFWDLKTRKIVKTLTCADTCIKCLALSPDGRLLALLGFDHGVRVWELQRGKKPWHFDAPMAECMAFLARGEALVLAGQDSVISWSTKAHKITRSLTRQGVNFSCLAGSPDDRQVAAGTDRGQIFVFDAQTMKITREFRAQTTAINSVVISPDSKLLACAGLGQTIGIWDLAEGRKLNPGSGHSARIGTIAYAQDGNTLASGAADNSVRLWDVRRARPSAKFFCADGTVSCVVFDHKGSRLAFGSEEGEVHIVDVAKGSARRLAAHGGALRSLAFSPDGAVLACAAQDLMISTYDLKRWLRVGRALVDAQTDPPLALSPDGVQIAASCRDTLVRLWYARNGKPVADMGNSKGMVYALAFSPDGTKLAAIDFDYVARVWDLTTRREIAHFAVNFFYTKIAFSPDGRMLATADPLKRSIRVWEVATGEVITTFHGTSAHSAIAFSPDARTLAAAEAGDCTILLWDVTGLLSNGQAPTKPKSRTGFGALWNALGYVAASRANKAMWRFVVAGDPAVGFLEAHIRTVQAAGSHGVPELIRKLDSNKYLTRENVERQLAALREVAEPELRRAAARNSSPEVSRRVRSLLDKLKPSSPQSLREIRSVAAIEHIGTARARQLLSTWAKGAPQARLTREAKQALRRLGKK